MQKVASFEYLWCTESKSLVTLAWATYRFREIINSLTTTQLRPPDHRYDITKRVKEMVMICSFGSFEESGQTTSRVFKPPSAEGTYLGEILGNGKQKYVRLRYLVFGFRTKVWRLIQNKLTWNISACPRLKSIPVHHLHTGPQTSRLKSQFSLFWMFMMYWFKKLSNISLLNIYTLLRRR